MDSIDITFQKFSNFWKVILKTKWFANVYKVSNLINVNFQAKPISIENN